MKDAVVACLWALVSAAAVAQPANAPDLGYAPAPEPSTGLYIGAEPYVYLANGHYGQVIKLDMHGAVTG